LRVHLDSSQLSKKPSKRPSKNHQKQHANALMGMSFFKE
jgi:hypothetical protein